MFICLFICIGFEEDEAEKYTTPANSLTSKTVEGVVTHTAKNGRGRRTLKILKKEKQEFFISLQNAFLNFNSLLPSNLEIGIRIYLTTPEKYFTTTSSSSKPTFKILDAKLLVEFILLKPVLLQAMESRLARSFLQIDFLAKFVKSFRY